VAAGATCARASVLASTNVAAVTAARPMQRLSAAILVLFFMVESLLLWWMNDVFPDFLTNLVLTRLFSLLRVSSDGRICVCPRFEILGMSLKAYSYERQCADQPN
jgi:hypothetical protein